MKYGSTDGRKRAGTLGNKADLRLDQEFMTFIRIICSVYYFFN